MRFALISVLAAIFMIAPGCAFLQKTLGDQTIATPVNPCENAREIIDRTFCLQATYIAALETCDELTARPDANPSIIRACADGSASLTPMVKAAVESAQIYIEARSIYRESNVSGINAAVVFQAVEDSARLAIEFHDRVAPLVREFSASIDRERH